MGSQTPTITDILHREEQNLAKFRRALRREDQRVFDDLFVAAYKHRAAAGYAGHLLAFETFLLCMQLENHKEAAQVKDLKHEVIRLRAEVEYLRRRLTEKDYREWKLQAGYSISIPTPNAE
jgi:hypothetical protein